MRKCKRLVKFLNSSTKTHKRLVEAGKQQSETLTTLKRVVPTGWNSSYATLESILKNQKILQRVLLDDSFEESRQSLPPTVSDFCSIRLLCSLLAPFADATNLLEGETCITASLGHAVLRQLRSELLEDGLEIWRDRSAVEKLHLAEVREPFDTSTTCHFMLPFLTFHGDFICHLSLRTSVLHCFHSMSKGPELPCTSTHHRLDASC